MCLCRSKECAPNFEVQRKFSLISYFMYIHKRLLLCELQIILEVKMLRVLIKNNIVLIQIVENVMVVEESGMKEMRNCKSQSIKRVPKQQISKVMLSTLFYIYLITENTPQVNSYKNSNDIFLVRETVLLTTLHP